MALLARLFEVDRGQRDLRSCLALRPPALPPGSVVASSAGCREARRLVARGRRVVVVGEVAVGAGSTQARKLPVDVALLARHVEKEPGQGEVPGRVVVIAPPPARGAIAKRAAGRAELRPRV